jgi:hypothetical protein
MNKYGKGSSEQVLAAASGVSSSSAASSYAMFGGGVGEVRRRRGGAGAASDPAGGVSAEGRGAAQGPGQGHARWKAPPPPVSAGPASSSLAPVATPYGEEGSVGGEDAQALQQSRIKRGRLKQQSAHKVEQSIAQVSITMPTLDNILSQWLVCLVTLDYLWLFCRWGSCFHR